MAPMRENDALKAAEDISEQVQIISEQLEDLRIQRAKAFKKANEQGYTQQQIADACELHIKTVQADIKSVRNK